MRFAGPVLAAAVAVLGSGALIDGCHPATDERPLARQTIVAEPVVARAEPVAEASTVVVNCGVCHTLAAAGASGRIGPDLDEHVPSAPAVASLIRHGRGTMPPFGDLLSDEEIRAIAAYVVDASASTTPATLRR